MTWHPGCKRLTTTASRRTRQKLSNSKHRTRLSCLSRISRLREVERPAVGEHLGLDDLGLHPPFPIPIRGGAGPDDDAINLLVSGVARFHRDFLSAAALE